LSAERARDTGEIFPDKEPNIGDLLVLLGARVDLAERLQATENDPLLHDTDYTPPAGTYIERRHDLLTGMLTSHVLLRLPLHVRTSSETIESSVDSTLQLAHMKVHVFRPISFEFGDEEEVEDSFEADDGFDGHIVEEADGAQFIDTQNTFIIYIETPGGESDTCFVIDAEGVSPFDASGDTVADAIAEAFDELLTSNLDSASESDDVTLGNSATLSVVEHATVDTEKQKSDIAALVNDLRPMSPVRFTIDW
jgi:hypothetical protein